MRELEKPQKSVTIQKLLVKDDIQQMFAQFLETDLEESHGVGLLYLTGDGVHLQIRGLTTPEVVGTMELILGRVKDGYWSEEP